MQRVPDQDQKCPQELHRDPQQNATHKLIYRGCTYEVPQQRVRCPEQAHARRTQLVDRQLIYRGNIYEVMPLPETRQIVTKIQRQLIYRGVSFIKEIEVV
jgi:Domain of unknown function (DUF4278)